ncbi:hypothetical protein KKH23_06375 [Patescibacteria group bacterium]|uniref:Uncharacterized protein n=1 Tax=viral metagenome TaxID=1070528 RepID=A0A6M3M181_9ZZZZ|nr:hypothetical protein [Patescibacteria group bacterium]
MEIDKELLNKIRSRLLHGDRVKIANKCNCNISEVTQIFIGRIHLTKRVYAILEYAKQLGAENIQMMKELNDFTEQESVILKDENDLPDISND